jgi:hypothetical protein
VVRSSVTSGYQSGRHRDYGVTVYGRAVGGVVSLAGNGRGGQAGQLQVPRTRRRAALTAALMVQAMHSRRPSKINAAPWNHASDTSDAIAGTAAMMAKTRTGLPNPEILFLARSAASSQIGSVEPVRLAQP